MHVVAVIVNVAAVKTVEEAKVAGPRKFFHFFENFFRDFQWLKYIFFKKCSKNGLVSEKKLLYFFPLLGGGGGVQTPKWKFPLFIFIFF